MKPHWTDHCEHNRPVDRFLGTVTIDKDIYDVYIHQDNKGIDDVYVYQDNALKDKPDMHICLRYGNEWTQFLALGNVDEYVKMMKERNAPTSLPPYKECLPLLEEYLKEIK